MTPDTASEPTEATAKPAPKKVTAKTTARKPAAKKTATRKAAAKKAVEKKSLKDMVSAFKLEDSKTKIKAAASKAQAKVKESTDMAQTVVKTVVYAQLGVYGKIYDEFSSKIVSTRTEVPKQWDSLVKRGEKVQKDFGKSQDEIKAKIKAIDLKADLKEGVEKIKESTLESFEKVKAFGKKAA